MNKVYDFEEENDFKKENDFRAREPNLIEASWEAQLQRLNANRDWDAWPNAKNKHFDDFIEDVAIFLNKESVNESDCFFYTEDESTLTGSVVYTEGDVLIGRRFSADQYANDFFLVVENDSIFGVEQPQDLYRYEDIWKVYSQGLTNNQMSTLKYTWYGMLAAIIISLLVLIAYVS